MIDKYNYPLDNPLLVLDNPEFLIDIKRLLDNTITTDCCGEEELESMKYYFSKPRIIDNRLNHDQTFAIRFYDFVKDLDSNDKDEKLIIKKMTALGKDLFNFQLKTVKNAIEIDYLYNIGQYDKSNNKPVYL